MKPKDYQSILTALEKALKICDDSWEEFDEAHRQI